MTADIAKARGENATPCEVPIYDAPADAPFSDIATFPIVNTKGSNVSENSILSQIPGEQGFLDMQGTTVLMVSSIGGRRMMDKVELVGVKNASFIVRINGSDYAVRKSIVRFIVNRE